MDPWLALFLGIFIGVSVTGWIAQQNPRFFASEDRPGHHKTDLVDRM